MVIYYYDDETNMNDADATEISLGGTYNIYKEHSIPIGIEQTFIINSFNYYKLPKTLGNDLFIVRFLYKNGTEAEIL